LAKKQGKLKEISGEETRKVERNNWRRNTDSGENIWPRNTEGGKKHLAKKHGKRK